MPTFAKPTDAGDPAGQPRADSQGIDSRPASAEVVVVGGGILGAAIASALTRRGIADVVVLEQEPLLGQHSTNRSVAYFIPMYESTAFAALAQASAPFLRSPPPAAFERPIFRQDGALIASTANGLPLFEREVGQARELGVEIQVLAAREILDYVPIVRADRFEAAAFYPSAGEIDVDALLQGWARSARRDGARFVVGCRYLGAGHENGRIARALTSDGPIACRHIVDAAGAWAGVVGEQSAASPIAFDVLRRHIVSVPLPSGHEGASWPFFRAPSLPLFLKPHGRRLLCSPMDVGVDAAGDCQVDPLTVAATVKAVNEYTTLQVDGAVTAIAGHRVFAATKLPVVGPDPELAGFHWAAGLGGAGIMAAPAVADIIAEGVLTGRQPVAWTAVSPARSMTANRSVS